MKSFFGVITLMLSFIFCGFGQNDTLNFYYAISIDEEDDFVSFENHGVEIEKGSAAKLFRIQNSKSENINDALAVGIVKKSRKGVTKVEISFLKQEFKALALQSDSLLIEVTGIVKSKENKDIFFHLARLNILMTDVLEEKLFYDPADVLNNENAINEKALLESMVKDIQYTAREMRTQMESPMIKEGPYKDSDLFTVMEETDIDMLMDFFNYLQARPRLYMGAVWKLSEIYATWVFEGAPMVVDY